MKLWKWWQAHRTWVLGTAQGIIIGFLGTPGLVAEGHRLRWTAVGIVVTVLIGQGGMASVKSIRNTQQENTQ